MSKRTKKVGPAGRLGARYGVRIRHRIADIETQAKGKHECPKCSATALAREANGIWLCRHCGAKLASSSYYPTAKVAVRREVAEVLAEAAAKEERAEEELEAEELLPERDEMHEEKADKKPKKE